MNLPHRWKMFGPGLIIPVFFLSPGPVSGQFIIEETTSVACGGTFVSRSGFSNALSNQAGLGRVSSRSVTIQHSRPFILADLGISTISVQIPSGKGALGATLTCFGIKGLYNTSGWLSYGMKLHPAITAGAGIHFWFSSIAEGLFYHPGLSCGIGVQARINDLLVAGGHVMYPAGWSADHPGRKDLPMILTAGCSYRFFNTATYHADLHMTPGNQLRISHGIELSFKKITGLQLGMHNHPYAASLGIELETGAWNICCAAEYCFDTGSSPSTALTYVW